MNVLYMSLKTYFHGSPTFSLIVISGDWDGNVRHLISFSVFHSLVAIDEWIGELSSWNK